MLRYRPRNTLVIMAKFPQAGRVKTRLGRVAGMTAAAWWYRHQLAGLIRRLGRDPRWETVLYVTPDRASGLWTGGLTCRPQGSGNLGQRMMEALGAEAPGRTVLIGSDIPDISPVAVHRAFRAMGRADAVFGPATDGGYWLIGLARPGSQPKTVFDRVRWSTDAALKDSIDALGSLRVTTVDMLVDVDTISDIAPRGIRANVHGSQRWSEGR